MKKTLSLLLILLVIPLLYATNIDKGMNSVENPLITVEYTSDVRITKAMLIGQDPNNPKTTYALDIQPDGSLSDIHELRTEIDNVKSPLFPGPYLLSLWASDQKGESIFDTVNFSVSGPEIELIIPKFGVSLYHPFLVRFKTVENDQPINSTCEWNLLGFDRNMNLTDNTSGDIHEIYNINNRAYLYISCEVPSGRKTARRFWVDWDEDAPEITATANPALVRDVRKKRSVISIKTDDRTVCSIDGNMIGGASQHVEADYAEYHQHIQYFNSITDETEHKFTYNIACINLAGSQSNTTVDVTVNLALSDWIDVLQPNTPYVNSSSFKLIVNPTFVADTCSVNGKIMTKKGVNFEEPFSKLKEGINTFGIDCVGSGNATREYNVTVDTQGPKMDSLAVPKTTCQSGIKFTFNATDNVGVKSYKWTVFEGEEIKEQKTAVYGRASTYLLSGDYTITVYAVDKANNKGGVATATMTVLDADDPACEDIPTTCTYDSDCKSTEACKNRACRVKCTQTSQCASPDVCSVNVCLPPPSGTTCSSSLDCKSTEVCVQGECQSTGEPPGPSCTFDSDCTISGQVCKDDVCVTEIDTIVTLPPGCVSDFECDVDEECRAGMCISLPNGVIVDPIDSSKDGAFPWIAVVLLVLGVVTMGGSGYYLYEQHQEKMKPSAPAQLPPSGPAPADMPQQQTQRKVNKDKAVQQQRIAADAKKRREQRTKERKKVFKKFDKKGKEGDVFDKLEKIGK